MVQGAGNRETLGPDAQDCEGEENKAALANNTNAAWPFDTGSAKCYTPIRQAAHSAWPFAPGGDSPWGLFFRIENYS